MSQSSIHKQWSRLRQNFRYFTWGGPWAAALSENKRRNLTLFFYDGIFAAISDKIILTYSTLYLLSLGATGQQIGLLNAFSNLAAAFILLPAALMVERSGDRKGVTVRAATSSRICVLLMALIPLFALDRTALIWVILALALLREVFNNLGFPGWMSLTADIVPIEGRGRYFGTRNFVMGLAGIITALIVGQAITSIGEPLGYQLAYILAALTGGGAIYYFSRLHDPQAEEDPQTKRTNTLREILFSLKGQENFIKFCLFAAVWNFSINIFGPFVNVFMVETLKFTAAMIGFASAGNTIANLVIQRRIGYWADQWGNRKLSIIFLFLIPILPLFWGAWVQEFWQAALLQVLGGFLWGAYNLVSFNNLLVQTPEKQRARFSAYYQIIVTFSMSGGAALGALLIPMINFSGLAFASAIGRWVAALLFLIIVRDPPVIDNQEGYE
jgi:MFS family permease